MATSRLPTDDEGIREKYRHLQSHTSSVPVDGLERHDWFYSI